MTAATREQLWHLWEKLLGHCISYMESTPVEKRTVMMLELIRATLRDQGIRVDARSAKDVRDSATALLESRLPFN